MRLTGCALGRAVLIQLGHCVGPCLGPSPGPVLGGFIRFKINWLAPGVKRLVMQESYEHLLLCVFSSYFDLQPDRPFKRLVDALIWK